jgi:rod shape-determining protein MreD
MKTSVILINILRFLILVSAQVFIFSKINLGGYLNPMVYILFVLLLPFELSGSFVLILSFFLGLSVDLFTGSIGLHAGAATFMAFLRPLSLRVISSNRDYESGILPGVNDLGYAWFITYALFLSFFHHLFYFMVEAFNFRELPFVLLRVLLNTMLTTVLLVFIEILFKPQAKKG